jgi:hypothetical protein
MKIEDNEHRASKGLGGNVGVSNRHIGWRLLRGGALRARSGECLTALLVLVLCGTAQAQTPPSGGGWQPGTRIDRQSPSSAPQANPGSPTTERPETVEVRLSALQTERGPRIEQGTTWRIYLVSAGAASGGAPQLRLLETRREAAPVLRLSPGTYAVNVAFGRANTTRTLKVAAGPTVEERFVLEAGGLRVRAALASGEAAPDMSVSYDVYRAESDQSGNRRKIVSNAKPGVVLRLNSGLYQVVSAWGDANAIVRADVAVEPGKITEAVIAHHGAKVTFKLVQRSGGEAIADTAWVVHSAQGETVVESSGALPTHILAAGTYSVSARHAGRLFKREFILEPGDPVHVELEMR